MPRQPSNPRVFVSCLCGMKERGYANIKAAGKAIDRHAATKMHQSWEKRRKSGRRA